MWPININIDININQFYKCKSSIIVHIGQKEFGVNYFETYSPVVMWFSIRALFILMQVKKWNSLLVNFVLSYPQAKNKYNFYM